MDSQHRVLPAGFFARSLPPAAAAALVLPLLFVCSCASPGHPSPPSLQVPRLATGLSAFREGAEVHLRWTTPTRTTDAVELKTPITAEICRQPVSPSAHPSAKSAPCVPLKTLSVRPGASEASDQLPPPLTTGSPRLLAYQVQLRGSLGKTAGSSPSIYVAAGAAPAPIADLRVTDTKEGALLRWTAQPAESQTVEITRELVSSPGSAPTPPRSANPFRPRSGEGRNGPAKLSAGLGDPGGAVDRTAAFGATYRYAAERILTVTLGAHTLELRSAPSVSITFALRDTFPPAAPAGLVATPGPGSIDLSWEPVSESGVAGYRVYRADPAGNSPPWRTLTPELLTSPSYRDVSATSGHGYRYRVTAIGSTGIESTPSPDVSESAP